MNGSVQADRGSGAVRCLVCLAPDLTDTVQHLTWDIVILHDCFPIPEPTQLPLDHEGPNQVSRIIQHCAASFFPIQSVLRCVEGAYLRKGSFNLTSQGP